MSLILIKNGPSKFDLMLGLFDRYEARTSVFELETEEGRIELDLIIMLVGIHNRAEENWVVQLSTGGLVFKGWYNTKKREGVLECEEL